MNRHPFASRLLALLPLFLVPCAYSAPPAAEVELALDELAILPGAPSGLSVTVSNRSASDLRLPSSLWLVAKNEADESFVVRYSTMVHEGRGERFLSDAERSLAPNAVREFRFDPNIAVAGTSWFMETRLWTPGRYRLRAVLAAEVNADGTFDASSTLVSPERVLRVVLLSEEDAAVWQWLQEEKWREGAWLNRPWPLATFVADQHPKSGYALFIALYLPVADDRPSRLFEELMTRYPDKPFTQQLILRRIFWYQQSSYVAWRHGDLYHAGNDAEAGRELAATLARTSRSANVRSAAADLLHHIPTREQLKEKP